MKSIVAIIEDTLEKEKREMMRGTEKPDRRVVPGRTGKKSLCSECKGRRGGLIELPKENRRGRKFRRQRLAPRSSKREKKKTCAGGARGAEPSPHEEKQRE